MSLTIPPSTPSAALARQGALPAGPAVAARDAMGVAGVAGTGPGNLVAFSPAAVLLAQLQAGAATTLPVLPAPGSAQAAALATLLAQRMGVLLRDAGLPAGTAVVLEVGGDEQVRIASGHPDVAALQALVNAHPDVQVLVRLLHAINAPPDARALAANLLAPQRREAHADRNAAAPAAPLLNLWGWPGATPRRHAAHARLPMRLVWLAAAVLAILAVVVWQW